MIDNYRLLLKQAALIYEKHEVGRKEPFNIFTILRKENDEVYLHSPFLTALLDYQSSDTGRQNLKDFLQRVGIEEFEQDDAKIRREYRNIDILISNNTTKQAVVIENKIKEIKYRRDEPQQLQRYHKILQEEEGYRNIRLLYLTLDGHEPSEDSVGNLPYETISYRDDLLPWLRCCQMHACDEPELRESVAQYIHLIRKLTGTDFKEAYMDELKSLLFEDNNLVLAHDLNEAMTSMKKSLMQELWREIESALKKKIPSDPSSKTGSSIYYNFGICGAKLGVDSDPKIFFGVKCNGDDYQQEYDNLRCALEIMESGRSSKGFPWWQYADGDLNLRDSPPEVIKQLDQLLSNEEKRKKFADEIADGLKEVWEKIKKAGLA